MLLLLHVFLNKFERELKQIGQIRNSGKLTLRVPDQNTVCKQIWDFYKFFIPVLIDRL